MARQSIWRVWSAGRDKRLDSRLAHRRAPLVIAAGRRRFRRTKFVRLYSRARRKVSGAVPFDEHPLPPAPTAAPAHDRRCRAACARVAAGLAGVQTCSGAEQTRATLGVGDTGARETATQPSRSRTGSCSQAPDLRPAQDRSRQTRAKKCCAQTGAGQTAAAHAAYRPRTGRHATSGTGASADTGAHVNIV